MELFRYLFLSALGTVTLVMTFHVIPQIDALSERFVAELALEFQIRIVHSFVLVQIRRIGEGFTACVANVVLFVGVAANVDLQGARLVVRFRTH